MRNHTKNKRPEINLSGAKISNGAFENVDMRRIEAHEANFKHVRFDGSDLSSGKIQCTIFDTCDMESVNFVDTDFTSSWGICYFDGSSVYKSDFSHANLKGASLKSVEAEAAWFDATNLEGCDMEYFEAPQASFRGANLKGANLDGANLFGCNFEGADLSGANLEGANLEQCNLKGAICRGVNFKGSNIKEANLEGADLTDSTFEDADLRYAEFHGSRINGANFQGAIETPAPF